MATPPLSVTLSTSPSSTALRAAGADSPRLGPKASKSTTESRVGAVVMGLVTSTIRSPRAKYSSTGSSTGASVLGGATVVVVGGGRGGAVVDVVEVDVVVDVDVEDADNPDGMARISIGRMEESEGTPHPPVAATAAHTAPKRTHQSRLMPAPRHQGNFRLAIPAGAD